MGVHHTRMPTPEVAVSAGVLLDAMDRALITHIQQGLKLVPRPYLTIAEQLGVDEREIVDRIARLKRIGVFKRFGVVVRHHELGYRANGMVVWDVPDQEVSRVGRLLAQSRDVRLCYRRPRRLPEWPYNLFCMIHGRDRDHVLSCLQKLIHQHHLDKVPHEVLFSTRRFKQRGAVYQLDSEPRIDHDCA